MSNDIEVRVGAESSGLDKGLSEAAQKVKTKSKEMEAAFKAAADNIQIATEGLMGRLTSLFSLGVMKGFLNDTKQAVMEAEASYRGLEAVANYAGVGIGRAMESAGRVAADGLMTTAEASKALQNLLARGYSLEQAENTLLRLKDAAAYNRSAHLSMGEAVVTATEGLKNENSVLVDNAGVTKNVSKMWEEYAAKLGKSTQSLTQAEKIQAEYNGVMSETEAQVGNAAKASDSLQGKTASVTAKFQDLKIMLGERLTPAFEMVADITAWVIGKFDTFIRLIQISGAQIAKWGADIGAVFRAVTNWDFSKLRGELKMNADVLADMVDDIMTAKPGSSFTPSADSGRRRAAGGDTAVDPKAAKAAAREAERAADLAFKLEMLRVDAIAEAALAAVDAEQAMLEKRASMQGVALDEMVRKEQEFENRRYEIQRAALDAELSKTSKTKDPADHAALLNKIESLEMAHAAKVQAIRDQGEIESFRRAQQLATMRSGAAAAASLDEVAAAEEAARQQLNLKTITQEEFLALEEQFEQRRFEIQRNALLERQALVDPMADPIQFEALGLQIEDVERQHQQRMTQIRNDAELERSQYALSAINTIQGGVQNSLQQVLMGQMTLAQGLKAVWTSVLSAITGEIAKFVAKWIAQKLYMMVFDKAAAMSEIAKEAGKAGARGVASMAAAPFPLNMTAPAFGAAMAAAAMAFAPMASAAGGFDIPAGVNPLTQLHAKEMVLPERLANTVRRMAGEGEEGQGERAGGDPQIHVHVTSPDGDGVRRMFMNNQPALIEAIKNAYRNGIK